MNRSISPYLAATAVLLAALLAGCASKPSYVVLLRDPDGALGKVVVTNPQGEQVLTEPFKGVMLDGKSPPYFVMQEQLKRDFGAAMAALPILPPESYVVLLRDPEGGLGKLVVANPKGQQVLTEALKGVNLDGSSPAYAVTQDQLKRDFGAALAATPQMPAPFPTRIEFLFGGAIPTDDSIERLKEAAAGLVKLAQTRSLDISVIGHTDSVGPADRNYELGLRRATSVANILRDALAKQGFTNIPVLAASHGKSDPLFDVGDETPEPRNRRVEIIVR
jgi:outer membrane protein OmpA-like peptidoglycan-associated protein